MGLVKTVASPFTNTTSLVSIILVIILIAVFRWDGGEISNSPVGDKKKKELNFVNLKNQRKVNNNKLQGNTGTIEINADEFDELMRVRKPQKKVEKKKVVKENSFDSIEADLGLR